MNPFPGNLLQGKSGKTVYIGIIAGLLLVSDCARPAKTAPRENDSEPFTPLAKQLRALPVVRSVQSWNLPECIQKQSLHGMKIITPHYEIYTSLQDPLILRQTPAFLESAFRAYCGIIGGMEYPKKKLQVYLFGNRRQWEDFTRFWTGTQAQTYLKIRSGAYYARGACVAYHIGRTSNFSVLAHEGWHQFVDELFVYRLPAWLDEGIAVGFEAYEWQKGQVRFMPRLNGPRLAPLQQALRRRALFPLQELLTLDAGRVVSHASQENKDKNPDDRIAVYYAQLYALVRFLREDNYGQHRRAFRRLVNDGRLGRWSLSTALRNEALQRRTNPSQKWNAEVGQELFRQYITPNHLLLEPQYQRFCQKILYSVRFH